MNTVSACSRCRALRIKSQSRHSDRAVRTNRSAIPLASGCLNRRPDYSDVFGLEDAIKAVRELTIVIADQKTNRFLTFGERPGHLPRLLHDPFGVG